MAMSDGRGLGLEPDPSQARVDGKGAMGEKREARSESRVEPNTSVGSQSLDEASLMDDRRCCKKYVYVSFGRDNFQERSTAIASSRCRPGGSATAQRKIAPLLLSATCPA